MKIAVFDSKSYDVHNLTKLNKYENIQFEFYKEKLNSDFTENLSEFDGVCIFVNDNVDSGVIAKLKSEGIKVIFTRSAGFNQIDLDAAKENDIAIYRVPSYSPNAIAEHAVTLLLSLNRQVVEAVERTRKYNFSLEGLKGLDINNKKVGVIGTGKIGKIFAEIMRGFGANVIAYDVFEDETWAKENSVTYVSLDELLEQSKIISLHSPLLDSTKHMINKDTIAKMQDNVILINSSRGGLINTDDLLEALHNDKFSAVGLDVYENEQKYFFEKFTDIEDEKLKELLDFENVYVTAHQAFFTDVAKEEIYSTTINNVINYLNDDKTNIVE